MKQQTIRILLLEDIERDAMLVQDILREAGMKFSLIHASTREEFEVAVVGNYDIAICDSSIPGYDGYSAMRLSHELHPDTPVIIISGVLAEIEAVNSIKQGAADYILKHSPLRLAAAVEQAIVQAEERKARRATEQRLYETERLYSTVFEHVPSPLALSELETGKVMEANKAFEKLFGFSRQEIVGKSFFEIGLLDQASSVEASRLLAESRDTLTLDLIMRRKSGQQVHCALIMSRLRVKGQECAVTHVVDVTAEDRLREAEHFYRVIFQTGPAGMIVSDFATGQIREINDEALFMLGYSRETIIGSTLVGLGIWDKDEREEALSQLCADGAYNGIEVTFRQKGGSVLPAMLSLSLLETGGERRIIKHFTDLSAKAHLREMEKLYAMTFHQSAEAIFITEQSTHRIVDVNKAGELLYGLSRDEMVGKTALELGFIDASTQDELSRLLNEKVSYQGAEIVVAAKGGKSVPVLVSQARISMGDLPCILTQLTDISSKSAVEEILRFTSMRSWEGKDSFFESLAKFVCELTGMDCCIVAEILPGRKRARALGMFADGQAMPSCEYDLQAIPCADVVVNHLAAIQNGDKQGYQRSACECQQDVESYFGAPLLDSSGGAIGLISLLSRKPAQAPETVETILKIAAARAEYEFERWRHEEAMERHRDELENASEQLSRQVDELQRKEDALQKSEGDIRLILDSAAEGIYGVDTLGNCVFVNQAFLRILGYAGPDEIVGKHVHSLIHHTRKDGTPYPPEECKVCQAFREGKGTNADDEVFWKADGTRVYVEYWAYPQVKDGKVIGAVATFMDITARKQAEQKLAEYQHGLERQVKERTKELEKNLSLLSATLEATADGTIVTDLNQYIIVYNENYKKLWRLPDSVVTGNERGAIGRHNAELTIDPQGFLKRINEIYADPECTSLDEIRLVDGRVFERYSMPQRLGNEVIGRVWSLSDITERKRAESALTARTEELDAVIGNAPILAVLVGEDCRVTQTNQDGLRPTKRKKRRELIGLMLGDVVGCINAPEGSQTACNGISDECRNCPVFAAFAATLKTGKGIVKAESTMLVRTAAGAELVSVLISSALLTGESGKQVLLYLDEITDIKKAEAVVKLNETRLEALMQLDQMYTASETELTRYAMEMAIKLSDSMYGFVAIASDDDSVMHVLVISEAVPADFGLPDEVLVFPVDGGGLLAESIRKKQPVVVNDYSKEFAGKKGLPEGHVVIRRFLSVPAVEDGRAVMMAGIANKETDYNQSDIHQVSLLMNGLWRIIQKRRADEALRQAKEAAEDANRAKSTFLANMSHEIRTPITAVLGYAQLLQRDTALNQTQRNYAETIGRSGGHLLDLINDVLEMSRIEAGRTEVNAGDFDFGELLRDIESMFRVRTGEKNLQFEIAALTPLPKYINSDVRKIRQALLNIIGNAVKFTEKGGIMVRVRCLEGAASERGSLHFQVEVEDTGAGIAPDEIERVFNPFEQSKKGISMGGTGLGMAISREFARLLGGDITVESKLKKGSKFTFSFQASPLQSAEVPEAADVAASRVIGINTAGKPAPKILVVDDVELNSKLLEILLQGAGFAVETAHNGKEAVEAFKKWKPDAVLMDRRMPEMDGIEATKAIKSLKAGRNTPIIMVTASAMEESRQEALDAGADSFISKPFREADVFNELGNRLKLEYIYAPTAASSDYGGLPEGEIARQISELPQDAVEALLNAAERGEVIRLHNLIDEKLAPSWPGLAEHFHRLAHDYRYDMIKGMLQLGEADD